MYNILFVDDPSELYSAMYTDFPWGQIGFQIVGQVSNEQEALQWIEEKGNIDVVFTDIRMPALNGVDLARELYERKSGIKVIFHSTYRDIDYAYYAILYGVREYLIKPAQYEALMNVITKIRMELEEDGTRTAAKSLLKEAEVKDALRGNGKLVQEIISYVEQHYQNVSLECVAGHLYMNANYLSQLFKQRTGKTFSDFVISVKMEKAAWLLQDFRIKTYEVSEKLGYSNAKNFSRTFKQFYGVTPSEFRNR
ncbi:response regulator transcription factor [Paenibacillus sp. FJAT-27812]|uniref:response regulator transcription factor n=1 Tax=Paenibacillus sp. FJAT-27812 TaxID=1684143 RepID=UPI0006A7B260|nr:helix-turn-helix domain-containing protein [Paenibacillus sp. FJAT-27812]